MIIHLQQVAELVGETKEHVWDIISKFAPQLDQLQQKDETIASATPLDPDTISDQYWRRVADNLIDLSKKFNSKQQVRQTVINIFIYGFCSRGGKCLVPKLRGGEPTKS